MTRRRLHRSTARLVGAAAVLAASAAAAQPVDWEGVCDYGAGQFEAAAVRLESRGGSAAAADPRAAYALARSLEEVGLRPQATTLLASMDAAADGRWRVLARRSLARLRFESRDRAALLAMVDPDAGAVDAEIAYLAGVAAADRREWQLARRMLEKIPAASRFFPYAHYVRAQAAAAAGDLDAALADLVEVIHGAPRPRAPWPKRLHVRELLEPTEGDLDPFALSFHDVDPATDVRDRAFVLRGKILYLQDHVAEAREAFAAVEGGGEVALEAVRGLAISGDPEAASRVSLVPKRPLEWAALLAARALAAERSGDAAAEWLARDEIGKLSKRRLDSLDRLAADRAAVEDVVHDLAAFEARLAEARAERRWKEEESEALDSGCSFERIVSVADVAFRPRDPLFYVLWTESRSDPWLRELIAIAADALRLARDLRVAPVSPGWPDEEERDALVQSRLRIVRVADLESRLADHLHAFGEIGDRELESRRRRTLAEAVQELRRLYLGIAVSDDALLPSSRASSATLDEVADDLERRADAHAGKDALPPFPDAALTSRLQIRIAALSGEIAGRLRSATRAAVRLERAAVERIAADNERSRSLLLGRIDVGALNK